MCFRAKSMLEHFYTDEEVIPQIDCPNILMDRIYQLQHEKECLISENKKLQTQLYSADETIKGCYAKLSDLSETVESYSIIVAERNSLLEKLDENQAECNSVQSLLDKQIHLNNHSETELRRAKERNAELLDKIDSLEKHISVKNTQLTELVDVIREYEDIIAERQESFKLKSEELEALKAEYSTLFVRLRDLEEESEYAIQDISNSNFDEIIYQSIMQQHALKSSVSSGGRKRSLSWSERCVMQSTPLRCVQHPEIVFHQKGLAEELLEADETQNDQLRTHTKTKQSIGIQTDRSTRGSMLAGICSENIVLTLPFVPSVLRRKSNTSRKERIRKKKRLANERRSYSLDRKSLGQHFNSESMPQRNRGNWLIGPEYSGYRIHHRWSTHNAMHVNRTNELHSLNSANKRRPAHSESQLCVRGENWSSVRRISYTSVGVNTVKPDVETIGVEVINDDNKEAAATLPSPSFYGEPILCSFEVIDFLTNRRQWIVEIQRMIRRTDFPILEFTSNCSNNAPRSCFPVGAMDQEAISAAGCRMERLHCGYLPPTYICARQQELTPDGCKLSEKSKQWPNSTANAHCPESTAPTCLTILPKSSHIPGRILLVIMSSFILSTAYLLYVGWSSLSLVVSIAGQSSFAESWPDPSPSHARGGLTYNFLRLFRSTGPSLNLELHYPYGMPPV